MNPFLKTITYLVYHPRYIIRSRAYIFNVSYTYIRHNFVGAIRILSVKICINPYPSSMHRDTFHEIRIAIWRKIATLRNKNRQPAAKTRCWNRNSISSKPELCVTWRDSRITWYASDKSNVLHDTKSPVLQKFN